MGTVITANAITKRVRNEFELKNGIPVLYDNDGKDPPDSEAHVYLAIRYGEEFQAEIARSGNRTFRQPGTIFILIRTPEDQGSNQSNEIRDLLVKLFRGVRADGVTYLRIAPGSSPSPGVLNGQRVGKWWEVPMQITFRVDEKG